MIKDVIHIPIIALIQLVLIYFWNKKLRNRVFKSNPVWLLAGFGCFFNVWGLDVVQRNFVIDTLRGMMLISVGTWLVFVAATASKYYAIYGWSPREFWLDYGGDLLGYCLSGILIFLAT